LGGGGGGGVCAGENAQGEFKKEEGPGSGGFSRFQGQALSEDVYRTRKFQRKKKRKRPSGKEETRKPGFLASGKQNRRKEREEAAKKHASEGCNQSKGDDAVVGGAKKGVKPLAEKGLEKMELGASSNKGSPAPSETKSTRGVIPSLILARVQLKETPKRGSAA